MFLNILPFILPIWPIHHFLIQLLPPLRGPVITNKTCIAPWVRQYNIHFSPTKAKRLAFFPLYYVRAHSGSESRVTGHIHRAREFAELKTV